MITGEPCLKWKLLSQLKINDIAAIDRSGDLLWPVKNFDLKKYHPKILNKKIKIKILPSELNEDLSFILGSLIAEGTIKENKIEFCNSDFDFIEEFKTSFKNVFPDCRLHEFNRKPNSF